MLIDVFLKTAVFALAAWAVISLLRKRPRALRPFDASAHDHPTTPIMTFNGSSDGRNPLDASAAHGSSHAPIDAGHHGGGFGGGHHGGFDGAGGSHGGGFDGGGGHSGH